MDTGSVVQQESVDTEEAPVVLDAGNAHGHLADWVQQDNVTRAIRGQFESFLHTCGTFPSCTTHTCSTRT